MTYEENKRLEQLEKYVAELTNIVGGIMEFFRAQRQTNFELIKFCGALSNEQVALLRCLVSSPLLADERVRQDCLDQVSRFESSGEMAEAMLAQLDQALKKLPPGIPPPDESTSSDSPT